MISLVTNLFCFSLCDYKFKQQSEVIQIQAGTMISEMSKTKLGSQWSLGWVSQGVSSASSTYIKKYRNESQVEFKEKFKVSLDQENMKIDKKRQTTQSFNKRLPDFNPKTAGKSSIQFGADKVDYRKKDQVFVNSNKL